MYITVYLIFTHSTIAKNQVKVDVVKYNTSIIEKTHILAERSWNKRGIHKLEVMDT